MSNWTEERTNRLTEIADNAGQPVSQEVLQEAAEELDVTTRSVGSKLRKLGYEVEKKEAAGRSFDEQQEEELRSFLEAEHGNYTYAEIAEAVCGGQFNARQVQGKILSMEMTDAVRPTPAKEAARTYSPEEEQEIARLVEAGNFIEDIADSLGRPVNSIRGKILSMTRSDDYGHLTIPKQRDRKEEGQEDPILALGDEVADLSVAEIAERIGKTERGVKTMLTHRGMNCANYKARKKKEA